MAISNNIGLLNLLCPYVMFRFVDSRNSCTSARLTYENDNLEVSDKLHLSENNIFNVQLLNKVYNNPILSLDQNGCKCCVETLKIRFIQANK